ncbi:hypothetical protein ASD15_00630 [Massilia sp. Root351]|jgi:hypothetical protein|uniref:DUF6587 family protein n=1 Tax=Massilia sp. Root351 TaxID=1736522 RepID=UPI00070CFA77|nr:DUF6587 family protein [Massilia sp. Root351]KQV90628.1 hypothetical protein ASD15_00630 [Massilia sp. Root351]
MWQQIIVGLIVAAALVHASTKYLPAGWRRRIVYGLARCGLNEDKLARFFKVQDSCGSGCGSCGSCGSGGSGGSKDAAAPPSPPVSRRVIKLHVQR